MFASTIMKVVTVALIVGCATVPPERAEQPVAPCEPKPAAHLDIRLAFDTGPSWWTAPDKECPQWSAALLLARHMAGCSENYVGDPAHKCQAVIRRCSPGCDVCRNLKPGEGPDTTFGSVMQPSDGEAYAATSGPGFFGGHDTTFDRAHACAHAPLLAKVMVHEGTHACRGAGGSKILYDKKRDLFRLGTPGCYADEIAPFEGKRQCGDPL